MLSYSLVRYSYVDPVESCIGNVQLEILVFRWLGGRYGALRSEIYRAL